MEMKMQVWLTMTYGPIEISNLFQDRIEIEIFINYNSDYELRMTLETLFEI